MVLKDRRAILQKKIFIHAKQHIRIKGTLNAIKTRQPFLKSVVSLCGSLRPSLKFNKCNTFVIHLLV